MHVIHSNSRPQKSVLPVVIVVKTKTQDPESAGKSTRTEHDICIKTIYKHHRDIGVRVKHRTPTPLFLLTTDRNSVVS